MSQGSPLVAIVNDDVAFVRLLDTLLREEEGVTTLLLHVGEIAHESIKQQQPNLVVLDIGADVTSVSWHMIDLLMLDPATCAIPVIVCSAANEFLQERRAKLEATGYRIIEKPFNLDELLSHVRALLLPSTDSETP
jgi:CheY-like chemotaxis protein